MSCERDQVRKFYDIIWNQHDHSAIPEILDERVKFRGSLGLERQGHQGFADYLDMVHDALGEFNCSIEALVCDPPQAFAKMIFSGIHKGQLIGYAPTGKRVTWCGAALFTFAAGKVSELWVLGDLTALEAQLKDNPT